jgi:hypothetical protein
MKKLYGAYVNCFKMRLLFSAILVICLFSNNGIAQTISDSSQLNTLSKLILDCYTKNNFIPLKAIVKADPKYDQVLFLESVEEIKKGLKYCEKDTSVSLQNKNLLKNLNKEYSLAKDYTSLVPLMFKFFRIYGNSKIDWRQAIEYEKFKVSEWSNAYNFLEIYFSVNNNAYYLKVCIIKNTDQCYLHLENATEVRLYWKNLEGNWKKI